MPQHTSSRVFIHSTDSGRRFAVACSISIGRAELGALAYRLPTLLFAMPFRFPSTANHFLHPQPYTAGQTRRQWNEPNKPSAEEFPKNNHGSKNGYAESSGLLFKTGKHGFVTNRWRWVEENIGFFAAEWHIRGASRSDRVRRCGYILIVSVLFA
jgi:hypothetical protein